VHSPLSNESVGTPSGIQPKLWRSGTLVYTTGGLVVLFCWLLWGDFAWALKERSVPSVVQLLLKKFAASDMLSGILIGSLPAAISMIVAPIVSYRSDRHKGRWGRRIPFLLVSTPIAALSMVGLAFSPALGNFVHSISGPHSLGGNSWILIFFGVFWTLFEVATIVANSVLGGLINDVVPQAVIGRFFAMFRALSLIAGMLFNFWLLGKAETSYIWIFVGIGMLYGGGFTIMCLKVKEGRYPPVASTGSEGPRGFLKATGGYFRECFGHSYYRWFFVAIALAWMSFVPVNLFSVYFAKSINMDMDTYGKCLALTYLLSLGLSYLIGSLADRFHPLSVGLVAQGLYALACLWGSLFARDVWTFGFALVAHGVLSGAWMTATASLGQRLLPKDRFAQFASALGIVTSLGTMAVGPIMGGLLDHTHHAYRYTYLAGFGLMTLALLAGIILNKKFHALGGAKHYTAPA
jgi:MFS family permease